MRRNIICIAAAILTLGTIKTAQAQDDASAPPKLVVSIVVSGLPARELERFGGGFSGEGFARFATEGTAFASARYGYMATTSPAGLATLTTGVNPSMHGIVAAGWIDHLTGGKVAFGADPAARGLGTDPNEGRMSPRHIVMPTVGDNLVAQSPASRVVSIASDAVSAIVQGGQSGTALWMDPQRAVWVTSTAYMAALPAWVEAYNDQRPANRYIDGGWTPARRLNLYTGTQKGIFAGASGHRTASFKASGWKGNGNGNGSGYDYASMLASPHGNTLVAEFAARVVENEALGGGGATDMLYICFDASRAVGQRYGSGSVEVEDMLYRLDLDLATLVRSVNERVGSENVLWLLTSDHGASEAWDARGVERDRFNVAQFKTIAGSFLGVQFGPGEWVTGYMDGQLWLNHNLVYERRLTVEEVQRRMATFVVQFRGVSHVMTSTALTSGYFASGWAGRMQEGFYPARGGDLVINLAPGWIEEREGARSLAGSMYDYDTHVPLAMMGWRIPARRVSGDFDMRGVAATLARFMGVRLTLND